MSEYGARGRGCVVVGIDEGQQPPGLLAVAAEAAEGRDAALAVVSVLPSRPAVGSSLPEMYHDQRFVEATALQNLHEAAATLHHSHPRLAVTTYCFGRAEVGSGREPLLWADLLVIGTQGGYGHQTLGHESVGLLLLQNSRCPVLVLPDSIPAPPTLAAPGERQVVLVGISEHPSDVTVVRAAHVEARSRGCELVLVHAYERRPGETPELARERAQSVVTLVCEAAAEAPMSVVITEDDVATALCGLAATASLLVIGGRTGSLAGHVPGSVSRAVLAAVRCPVLAIPRNVNRRLVGAGVRADDR